MVELSVTFISCVFNWHFNCESVFGYNTVPLFATMRYFLFEVATSENVPSGHALTAKAQIRLHGCAVWSGPSLSAARSIGFYRLYQCRAKPRMRPCACAGWSTYARFCACSKPLLARPIWCTNQENGPYSICEQGRSRSTLVFAESG